MHCRSRFHALVGLAPEVCPTCGSIRFAVAADDQMLAMTPTIIGTATTASVDVDIPAATTELELLTGDGGDGISNDHANWAIAALGCACSD